MIIHTYTTTTNGNEVMIDVTFTDDTNNQVVLQAQTTIVGDEQHAIAYVPIFIRDLERNFPHIKNPEPKPEVPPMEGEMI